MLEFIREEVSGNLVAHSETTKFKMYWIDEGAWSNLYVVRPRETGPSISRAFTYRSLEEAKSAANEMESET